MEKPLDFEKSPQKIYKDKAIWVGTFLGGPLVAGYLIAENFKAFDEKEKATKAWVYAIVATIIIFGGILIVPDNIKVPNQVIPLIYTATAYYLVQHLQGKNIAAHISSGGELHSWWRTITIGIIGFAIIIIPVFVFLLLA